MPNKVDDNEAVILGIGQDLHEGLCLAAEFFNRLLNNSKWEIEFKEGLRHFIE